MSQYPDFPHGFGPERHDPAAGPAPGHGLPPGQHPYGPAEPYGPQTGGYQAPPGYGAQPPGGEVPLLTIGDIAITPSTVITPAGRLPVRGSTWTMTDMSRTEEKTPAWAIIAAILIFWWTCLLGLLFLLVKERQTSGYIQVTVQGGGVFHSTMVPAHSPATSAQVMQQVNYVRNLSATP